MTRISRIRQLSLGIGALALANAFATLPAHAIALSINDIGETITATPGFGLTLTQEGIGILGDASYHFEYLSVDPNIPGNGLVKTFNVNWWEDFIGGTMSDTLGVTITGHITSTSNVSVDLSFLSGSLDDTVLPRPFTGGDTFIDTVEPVGFVTYLPLSDLSVTIASSIPEPATLALFGVGVLGLGALRRRRKTKA